MKFIFTSAIPNFIDDSPSFSDRSGQLVDIVKRIPLLLGGVEVGEMYRIRFSDGVECECFDDELTKV